MSCLPRGETSKKKSILRKDRRRVEFFFLKTQNSRGKKRMIIMTESTSYLDMNKKKPLSTPNQLSFVFQSISSPVRSLFFFENPTDSQPQNVNHSPINFLLLPSTRKKFFSTPTGIRTHTFIFLTARAQSAPSPACRRRRRRFPARARARKPAAAAARTHRRCRVILRLVSDGFQKKLEGWVFFPYQMPISNWKGGSFFPTKFKYYTSRSM